MMPPRSRFLRRLRAVALALVVFALPVRLDAQPGPKVTKIGLLTPSSPTGSGHLVEAFRHGLRELGYVEGKTFVVEARYGDGKSERLPDLVGLKPDVIVTSTDVATAAVKRATRTIPIVMALSTDPVATGFVASLARPGGNITGLSNISAALSGKRLELLREAVPGLSRVAFLWNAQPSGADGDVAPMTSPTRYATPNPQPSGHPGSAEAPLDHPLWGEAPTR